MRVVWLYGPPGAGKSSVGWELYQALLGVGRGVAYIDIDQLGMCYPEPDGDQDRHRLKGRALAALLPNFEHAGRTLLVVSGVLAPALLPWLSDQLSPARTTFIRLTLGEAELRRRLEARGGDDGYVAACLLDARALEVAGLRDRAVPSDGRTPTEVARSVERLIPPDSDPTAFGHVGDGVPTPGTVLWICGPTGVGKSAVGWATASALRTRGHVTAYLDLQQLAFVSHLDRPAGDALVALHVASLWRCFHAVGATHVVLSGVLTGAGQLAAYRTALPGVRITAFRLHARDGDLAQRIRMRGQGHGPRLAGDTLIGLPTRVLDRVAARAADEQRDLADSAIGDVVIHTSVRGISEIAEEIVARA